MRLAYLSYDKGIRYGGTKGAAVHLGEITRALAQEGSTVLILVAATAAGPPPPTPPGVTVETAPQGRDALAGRLQAFRADALIERFSLGTADGSAVAATLRLPHLVELNAPLVDEAVAYRSLSSPDEARALEARVLSAADVVLAVSGPLAGHARARGAERVELLPNAVSLDRFPPRHRTDGAGPPRVVLVGTLRPWHGTETVVDAWRLLGAEAPELLVVGGGPGQEQLEAVGADVTGPVPYDRVPALLFGCSIGLVPYAADAPAYFSPLKLFDYLAAGLAVVAADVPGVTDIVDRGSAVIVPAGDPGAMAGAVAALASDPGRRGHLGQAGRDLVAAHHTWRHRARRVMAIVRELDTVGAPS
ncbi:MAG: hypothetical protein QOD63_2898 [Actinomycetota bacterium]|nr:hypothetical protein [Actinomycetota bacterium]